ncbi:MAG: FAD-dependent thymidylate synthase [Nitrososphaerota archaeon]|nr:FAD-dependent thymidylate synthase [Nitrososphaerota archaeon]MDG6923538.1 FAD-dependent thymidylate synthase [Nitrososphaerota archaeon]
MRVRLLWYTPNPEVMVALAMRRCYNSKPIEELEKEIQSKPGYEKELIAKALRDKTFDVIEHAVFMFEIEGVSRICTHQLVRHRIASYDQESQRFSAVEREDFIVPQSIQTNPEALQLYQSVLKTSIEAFKKLKELEVPKEDARFVLPQSIGTKLVITANARSLMHFFYLRTAKQAQWEIRELAEAMLAECRKVAPTIFREILES